MDLKFYLNKFAKVDNIEHYTFRNLLVLKNSYESFLEKSEGKDPDFPLMDFGHKGQTITKGRNIYSMLDEEDNIPNDFTRTDYATKYNRMPADTKRPEIRSGARESRKRNAKDRERANSKK